MQVSRHVPGVPVVEGPVQLADLNGPGKLLQHGDRNRPSIARQRFSSHRA